MFSASIVIDKTVNTPLKNGYGRFPVKRLYNLLI